MMEANNWTEFVETLTTEALWEITGEEPVSEMPKEDAVTLVMFRAIALYEDEDVSEKPRIEKEMVPEEDEVGTAIVEIATAKAEKAL